MRVHGREISFRKPTAYQLKVNGSAKDIVESGYVLEANGEVGIRLAAYDASRALTIDPVLLQYSSLLGGSNEDDATGIAVDSARNVYVTGVTNSTDFPIVNQIPGACQGGCGTGNGQDIFVTKINAAGSALVYSSLIGSSGDDYGNGIAVDGSGNAYVTGYTLRPTFPS